MFHPDTQLKAYEERDLPQIGKDNDKIVISVGEQVRSC